MEVGLYLIFLIKRFHFLMYLSAVIEDASFILFVYTVPTERHAQLLQQIARKLEFRIIFHTEIGGE